MTYRQPVDTTHTGITTLENQVDDNTVTSERLIVIRQKIAYYERIAHLCTQVTTNLDRHVADELLRGEFSNEVDSQARDCATQVRDLKAELNRLEASESAQIRRQLDQWRPDAFAQGVGLYNRIMTGVKGGTIKRADGSNLLEQYKNKLLSSFNAGGVNNQVFLDGYKTMHNCFCSIPFFAHLKDFSLKFRGQAVSEVISGKVQRDDMGSSTMRSVRAVLGGELTTVFIKVISHEDFPVAPNPLQRRCAS